MPATPQNLIAQGREAEIFSWDNGLVLKLYRSYGWGHEAEVAALRVLPGDIAPRFIDLVEINGRPGLVMERVEGKDMLSVLEKAPWKMFSLARHLARIHVETNRQQGPEDLRTTHSLLRQKISRVSLPAWVHRLVEKILDDLPEGDRLCHGDFHPGNVLVHDRAAVVIDWPGATRGDPASDLARTNLLMHLASPPPGISLFMRLLIATGASTFASFYRREYLKLSPQARDLVDRWQIVHAAARLSEGIDEEIPKLRRYLESKTARIKGETT